MVFCPESRKEWLKAPADRADKARTASEETTRLTGKAGTMADYYACTELEPLLDEIRKCLEEANERQEPLTLTISNAGRTYPYVLQSGDGAASGEVQEVAGKALDMLRTGIATAS